MNGSTALVLDMLAVDVDPCDTTSLVARARKGDALAFGELVAEHEQTVLRTAWRMVRNVEDARDIAQEVFLRLHRHLERIDPDRDPAPWLYRVTVNLGLSALRRRRRRPEAALGGAHGVAEISAGQPEQERLGDAADARRLLASALDRLSDKERAAIVLRDLEGLEMGEVARALGCRRGTVRAHLSRGRLKLRGAIKALGESP
jgi:RNA polymerase sigma-70 factor (ECF subfamily)